MRYRSGDLEFDPTTATLHRPAGEVRLRKQLALTLKLLMERAPALVSTDELLDQVWGRHAISPSAVPQALRDLRRLLGDPAQAPQFIETRHRLGYRWLKPVEMVADETRAEERVMAPVLAEDREIAAPSDPLRRPKRVWAALIPFLLLAGALSLAQRAGWFSAATAPPSQLIDAGREFQNYRSVAALELLDALPASAKSERLRVQVAIARGDGERATLLLAKARAALKPADQISALWLDLLSAQLAGRDKEVLKILDALLLRAPTDPALLLLAFDFRRDMAKARVAKLGDDLGRLAAVTPLRAQLLAAQRAGLAAQNKERTVIATALLATVGAAYPGLAAQARLQLAEVSAAEGRAEEGWTEALQASAELESLLEYRASARALLRALALMLDAGAHAQMDAALVRLNALLAQRQDPTARLLGLHYQAFLHSRLGQDERALNAFKTLAEGYQQVGNGGAAASALSSASTPLYRLGRSTEIPPLLEQAQQLARDAGASDTLGYLLGSLGNHYVRAGDLERGRQSYLSALEAFRVASMPDAEATALSNLSELAQLRGQMDEALEHAERAQALQQRLGDATGLAYSYLRLVTIFAAQGKLDAAASGADRTIRAFAELGNRKEQVSAIALRGDLALRQADLASAQALSDSGASLEDAGPVAQSDLAQLRGRLAFYRGDFKAAAQALETSSDLRAAAGEQGDAAASQIALVELKLAQGLAVAVEEDARLLLQQPVVQQQGPLYRGVRLVLIESLLALKRSAQAEAALAELDGLLRKLPDAEHALRATLLRTRLDTNAVSRRERLDWVVERAQADGMRRMALIARGEIARLDGDEAATRWRGEIRSLGFVVPALSLAGLSD